MGHGTLRVEREGLILRVILNRPAIRNAFNDEMLEDLLEVFGSIRSDATVRAVVLTGEGTAFCAGADLNWMKKMVSYSFEENLEDSRRLARMLHELYTIPKPLIGRINGPAIGGGTGLVAVCDIAIASRDAVFSFSETKLGLTPATIAPYLLRKMGENNLREYFLTGERFDAEKAVELGLLNDATPPEELDSAVQARLTMILSGGPEALAVSKELIRNVGLRSLEDNAEYTAEVIARLRTSDEGQEGMNAFLQKRKPRWIENES